MQELVFTYNCTPHASTGYTPYFLFFGHDARLPVDNLLSLPVDRSHDADDFVQRHHHRMFTAIHRANTKMNMKADQRRKRHNKKAKSPKLPIGSTVLLRNRVLGRNKIQDTWNPIKHTVVGQLPDDSSALIVSRSTDSKVKTVNRLDLLPYPTEPTDSEPEPEGEAESSQSSSSDSSDELELHEYVQERRGVDPLPPPVAPRRTTRSTAGKHANPFHLPKSAMSQEAFSNQHSYSNYSSAIVQLGLGQAEILGKFLKDGYQPST